MSAREIDGRASWNLLHTRAAFYPSEPTDEEQAKMRDFIDSTVRGLSCHTCAGEGTEYIAENPPDLESKQALETWTCKFHNSVNEKLGKPAHSCARSSILKRNLETSAQRLYSEKASNVSDNHLATKGEAGLIIGSELAGAAATFALSWADKQLGNTAKPLHLRASTYAPAIGVLGLLLGAKSKMFKKTANRQLATYAFSAYLLAQAVPIADEAVQPGVTFAIVPSYPQGNYWNAGNGRAQAVIQPGVTPAPSYAGNPAAGYVGQAGIGGLRTIF